ncbi:MAG: hypothetical protein R2861_12975 [Desulfobacterales bacterium]
MTTSSPQKPERILLTGPTGFIGKRLLYVLDARGFQVRCLVRPGETLDLSVPLNHPGNRVCGLAGTGHLPSALDSMDAAYYLVHSMGGRNIRQTLAFEEKTEKPRKISGSR